MLSLYWHYLEFFPSQTQQQLFELENIITASIDIGVSSQWVKF